MSNLEAVEVTLILTLGISSVFLVLAIATAVIEKILKITENVRSRREKSEIYL